MKFLVLFKNHYIHPKKISKKIILNFNLLIFSILLFYSKEKKITPFNERKQNKTGLGRRASPDTKPKILTRLDALIN